MKIFPTASNNFDAKLDEILTNIINNFDNGLSNTSTNKFDELRQFLSGSLAIPDNDLYITSAGTRPGNLEVRLSQGIQATKHTKVGVGITVTNKNDPEDVADSVQKTIQKFLGRGKANYDHIIIGVADDEHLRFLRVITEKKDELHKKILDTIPGIKGTVMSAAEEPILGAAKPVHTTGISSGPGSSRYNDILKKHKNLVLYGPPGTGKTHIVMKEILPKYGTNLLPVIFHQSFTYDEFVEGLTPSTDTSGNISFSVKDGVFLDLIHQAEADPENPYCLYIDEMNRGNVAAIFGDFLTLIEDDKRGVTNTTLGISKRRITVPKNIDIIGTMNTADRSTQTLDAALRRRFHFLEIAPNEEILRHILQFPKF